MLSNVIDILPVDKPSYKRSSKSLKRIEIADVVGPKDSKNYENLKISDEDIDKLFNSNCGAFEEIKKTANTTDTSQKADMQDIKQIHQVKQEFKQQKSKMNQMSKPKKEVEILTKEKKGKNRQKEQMDQTSNETETERKEKVYKVRQHSIYLCNTYNFQRPLPPVPTTTAQFYCHWKELTERQKYPFLKVLRLNDTV